jgi:hypothetical protein
VSGKNVLEEHSLIQIENLFMQVYAPLSLSLKYLQTYWMHIADLKYSWLLSTNTCVAFFRHIIARLISMWFDRSRPISTKLRSISGPLDFLMDGQFFICLHKCGPDIWVLLWCHCLYNYSASKHFNELPILWSTHFNKIDVDPPDRKTCTRAFGGDQSSHSHHIDARSWVYFK